MFVRAQAASNCSDSQIVGTMSVGIQDGGYNEVLDQDNGRLEARLNAYLKLGIARSQKLDEIWNETGTNNRLYRGIFFPRK